MTVEEKVVFMIGKGLDEVPVVVIGVPTGAWEYMKDGKTHTFDLTKGGVPVKLVLFGATDHKTAMGYIEELSSEHGVKIIDERGKDWSV